MPTRSPRPTGTVAVAESPLNLRYAATRSATSVSRAFDDGPSFDPPLLIAS